MSILSCKGDTQGFTAFFSEFPDLVKTGTPAPRIPAAQQAGNWRSGKPLPAKAAS